MPIFFLLYFYYSVQQLTKPTVAIRFLFTLTAHINALSPTYPFIFQSIFFNSLTMNLAHVCPNLLNCYITWKWRFIGIVQGLFNIFSGALKVYILLGFIRTAWKLSLGILWTNYQLERGWNGNKRNMDYFTVSPICIQYVCAKLKKEKGVKV